MKTFFKLVLANIVAITIVFIGFALFLVILVSASAMGEDSKEDVASNSVLTLNLNTKIIDSPTENQSSLFSQDENKSVLIYDMIEAVKNAKDDKNIMGISLEADVVSAGLTQIDDLRAALIDFKKSGKFIYAYGNTVGQSSYYLSSVADQYFLSPAGGIELKGMSTEIMFFKDFADKYGISTEIIRHGTFKAAVEPFMRNDMSPENRLQMSTLLGDIWKNTSSKIYNSRKIDSLQFKTVVDSLYGILPELTTKYKLADKLIQKSEYDQIIRKKLNIKDDKKINRITFEKYIKSYKDEVGSSADQVAVLYASGTIYDGEGYNDIYAVDFIKQIKKLADNDHVKAVVLRVNSPGGSANASDQILFELAALKKKKLLVVSFGDYAASGGYYISMAADKIYSEPNTITGSIGVFGIIPYFKELANKNGVKSEVVSTNANSAMYSPINGLTPGAVTIMTKNVENTYSRFVNFVSANRKKSFAEIDEIGGGRVWSGTRAKQIGLVDELGSLHNAIEYATQKAGLKNPKIGTYPKKLSKFEQIFKTMDKEEISTKILENKLGKENYELFNQMTNPKIKEGIKMEMPYKIEIK
ncbi:signal peptide peptidase SppA [Frigoriflavimonas asaccharolytica]|uniref:Protease-4 n=1 Tax=Frigoriflavimonas asaccharolytica TaxID=2735899 RepID=A0A8J8GA44_9FLAO|nr:signal peptide peptidase SppA [Frigoriflavimonas asaccharolytica]NRS92369.1 protease-4 [Frigoriflavimonas asaccharolytica]